MTWKSSKFYNFDISQTSTLISKLTVFFKQNALLTDVIITVFYYIIITRKRLKYLIIFRYIFHLHMQFIRGAVDESIQTVQGQNHYLTVILRHHMPAILEVGALRTLFSSVKARFYSDSITILVIFH